MPGLCSRSFSNPLWKQSVKASELGPRSHQGHIPPQDVPKLRQLVQLGRGEDAADRRHATVAVECEREAVEVAGRSEFAKLVDAERPSIISKAKLREQQRPAAFEPDSERHDQEHRQEGGDCQAGTQDIKSAPQTYLANSRWRGKLACRSGHRHATAPTGNSAPSAAASEFTTSSTSAWVIRG